uniref:VCBS n=1 Tax=Chlorobium chlorochromatii (strain CaD3) TaxID=340177 RepID=Q3AR75_CHLCH
MSNTVVFIDSRISDVNALISRFAVGTEYYVLDSERDGILQITEALAGKSGYSSLQIFSHGTAGSLMLGSTVLNNAALSNYTAQLAAIGGALTASGDILLYGCNVAAGDVGQQFIAALAEATGADVAASDDLTGSAALGGDWDLEYATGAIESGVDTNVVQEYDGVLEPPTTTITITLPTEAEIRNNSNIDQGYITESTLGSNVTLYLQDILAVDTTNLLSTTAPTSFVISVSYGKISFLKTKVDTIPIVSGNGSNTVTLTGTITQIRTLLTNNTISYVGNTGFSGIETLSAGISGVLANNSGNASGSANSELSIVGINDAPTILDAKATLTVSEGSLLNDVFEGSFTLSDPDIAHYIMQADITVLHGTLKLSGDDLDSVTGNETKSVTITGSRANIELAITALQYTPDENYNGSDTLTVTVNDLGTTNVNQGNPDEDKTDIHQVTISVVNHAPVLENDYTPILSEISEDINSSITETEDGDNAGTLVKDIIPENDPTDSITLDAITDEDVTSALQSIYITAVDSTNGKWQFKLDGQTTWSTITLTGDTALLLSENNSLRFIPNNNWSGTATFTFGAWDGTGRDINNNNALYEAGDYVVITQRGVLNAPFSLDVDTATITVNPVNDAPTFTAFSAPITPAITTNQPSLALEDGGNTVGEPSTTPITITFDDLATKGNEADANDAAYGGAVTAFVVKRVLSGTLTIDNTDYTAGTEDLNLTISESQDASWTPELNKNGILNAFTVVAKDNDTTDSKESTTPSVTVTINLTPVNDAPTVIPATQSATLTAGSDDVTSAYISMAMSDVDTGDIVKVDGDWLADESAANDGEEHWTSSDGGKTYTFDGSYGTATLYRVATTDGHSAGEVTYSFDYADTDLDSLAANATATDSFTIVVSDDAKVTATADAVFTINGANDDPIITSGTQSGSVIENSSETATGDVNATDIDYGTTLSYSGDATGDYGSLDVTEIDGTWTYTLTSNALDDGESDIESFTITVSDGDGGSATQDVTITVWGDNDPPTITESAQSPDYVTEDGGINNGTAGTSSAHIDVTLSDADGGDTVSYVTTGWSGSGNTYTKTGTYGTATLHPNTHVIDYVLNNSDTDTQALDTNDVVSDSFSITVTDGTDFTSETIAFTIHGTNDAPTIDVSDTGESFTESDDASMQTLSATGSITFDDVDASDSVSLTFAESTDISWSDSNGGGDYDNELDSDYSSVKAALLNGFSTTATGWSYSTSGGSSLIGSEFGAIPSNYFLPPPFSFTSLITGVLGDQNDVTEGQFKYDVYTLSNVVSGTLVFAAIESSAFPEYANVYTSANLQLRQPITPRIISNTTDGNARILAWFYLPGDTLWVGSDAPQQSGAYNLYLGGTIAESGDGVDLDFLDEDEQLTWSYTVSATDGTASTTSTESVSFTITGENDAPTISISDDSATITENSGSDVSDLQTIDVSGDIEIDDPDTHDDTVTVTSSLDSISWSGGDTTDSVFDTLTDGFTADEDGWSYSVTDGVDLNFIGEDETVVLTYNVTASDGTESDTDTVTITIEGTNDTPTVDVVETSITFAEDDTLSDSGTVSFSDLDTNDVIDVTESYNNDIAWSYSGGTLTDEMIGEDISTLTNGFTAWGEDLSSDETVWNYSATLGTDDLDFLDAGETLTFSYTVTATDNNGASATDTITVTITGSNDTPHFNQDSVDNGSVTDTSASDTFSNDIIGTLTADDVDHNDTITYGVVNGTGTYGTLTVDSSTGVYRYDGNDNTINALNAGTWSDTFTVTASDGTISESATVVITIHGANDNPTVSINDDSLSFTEDVSASAQDLTDSGSITFDDVDTSDNVDIIATYKNNISWSGGTLANQMSGEDSGKLTSGFHASATDSTSDSITWDYSATDVDLDFLAEDETITLGFTITARDSHNAFATDDVTITITGTNDDVDITGGTTSGSVTELADKYSENGVLENDYLHSITGSIDISDPDVNDSHTATFTDNSESEQVTYLGSFDVADNGEDWTFTVSDEDLDYLDDDDDPLIQTYTITISDGHGSSDTQDVTITIHGSDDNASVAGRVYYWSNFDDIDDVATEMYAQDSMHTDGEDSGIEFRNIEKHDNGTYTLDIYKTADTDEADSFLIKLQLAKGSVATWEQSHDLFDGEGNELPDLTEFGFVTYASSLRTGECNIGGYSASLLSLPNDQEVKLGTLTITAPIFDAKLLSGSYIGDTAIDAGDIFSEMKLNVTEGEDITYYNGDGLYDYLNQLNSGEDSFYYYDSVDPDDYNFDAIKEVTTEDANEVTPADALLALKLSMGINTALPDLIALFEESDTIPLIPYMYMAADVNKDGEVTIQDALNILKMSVNYACAPEQEWIFSPLPHNEQNILENMMNGFYVTYVNDLGEDVKVDWLDIKGISGDETGIILSIGDNAIPIEEWNIGVDWEQASPELHDITVTDNDLQFVDLIGILKGDVNGSWGDPINFNPPN